MRRVLAALVTVTLVCIAAYGVGLVSTPHTGAGGAERPAPARVVLTVDRASGSRAAFQPISAPMPTSSPATTVIEANGSVNNASAPISQSGNVYTISANFSGEILIERNNSRLTASGATVTGTNVSLPIVEAFGVDNVTIDGVGVGGLGSGVTISNSEGVSVIGLTATPSVAPGLSIIASQSTVISNATLRGSNGTGILVQGSDGILVTGSNASGRPTGVVLVGSLNVSILGNDLTGCQVGVNASSDSALDLRDNRLNGTRVGIGLWGVDSASLQGNVAVAPQVGLIANQTTFLNVTDEAYRGADVGVQLTGSYEANLTGNDFTGDGEGVVAVNSGGLSLAHDNLSGFASVGIQLVNAVSAHLSENAISSSSSPTGIAIESINAANLLEYDNVAAFDPAGIVDIGGVNISLLDNVLVHGGSGGAGIALENDAGVTAFQNDFTNYSGISLAANGARASTLTQNYVEGTGQQGIAVTNSSALTIKDNTIRNAGPVGLSVENSSGCVVRGNSVQWTQSPAGTGVLAAFDQGPLLAFNNVSAAGLALGVLNTTNASVLDNNLSRSGTGISVVGDANSLVVANNVWSDNRSFAVAANREVSIYHNNFGLDAGWTAEAGPDALTWDAGYPEGGNFWSNHTGPDALSGSDQAGQGPDGIVDTPLGLGPAGADPYPLVTPWVPTYAIFSESGLLSSTPWSLIVNGIRLTSVAPGTILYAETNAPNATIAWTVPPVPGFTLTGVAVGGPWPEVRGANLTYSIPFFADRYATSFSEYGLAPGTPWTFIVNGQPEGGDTPTITISLPNGTYNYLAGSVTGYNLTVGAGVVSVAGPGALALIVYVGNPSSASSGSELSGTTAELLVFALVLAGGVAIALLGLYFRERRHAQRPAPLQDASTSANSSKKPPGGG